MQIVSLMLVKFIDVDSRFLKVAHEGVVVRGRIDGVCLLSTATRIRPCRNRRNFPCSGAPSFGRGQ